MEVSLHDRVACGGARGMNFLVAVLVVVAVSAGCVSTSGTPTAESDGTTVTVTVAPSTTVQDTTSATPTGVTPTTTQAPVAQELPPNERGMSRRLSKSLLAGWLSSLPLWYNVRRA